MRGLADALAALAVTLWVGGLWAIGYLAAPALFANLPNDRALAGTLAGKLFALIAWTGFACGAYLLLHMVAARRGQALRSAAFWIVAVMLGLTAAGHFGIQPILAQLKSVAGAKEVMESAVRDRFAAWHGVSSVLYLVQSLLGAVLVVLQFRRRG